jgi:hypothetical protein
MKKCIKCLVEQDIKNFVVRSDTGKTRNECTTCQKSFQHSYRENNREKAKITTKKWRQDNLEQSRQNVRRWRKENIEYARRKEREYKKNRIKNDPIYKITCCLRGRIIRVLNGKNKSDRTIKLIGCSPEQLKIHLESKFLPGMTWENHGFGNDKWHVDHIKPCRSFDLSESEQQRQCFNYKNLQPLWQFENLSKGAKIYV